MGMQVPTFTDPSQNPRPEGMPNVSVSTSAPAEAFGAGQSTREAQSAAMGAMKESIDVFKEEKDRADQLAHIQADTQASETQSMIQTKVAQMKGENALDAPAWAEARWKTEVAKIQNGLVGQNQKMAFARSSAQRWQDLNKSVETHVANEQEAFADQTYQSANDQARNSAVLNAGDDQQVAQNLGIQKQLMQGWAKRKGVPEDSDVYKQKLTTEISATNLGVIHARLESGNDEAAQSYFDANKKEMSAADILHAESILDASKVVGESQNIFKGIMSEKGFKFSDGTINAEKVRQYVMDQTDDKMSDQRKLKVLSQVKAQIAEYNKDRYHQIAANERSFANEVITARKNGQGLNDALKLAPKYGTDPYDIAQKQDFIQKTYAPPAETHVIAHEQLREGIQNGTVEVADIDRAKDKGDLSAEDWANLRQLKFKTLTDGTDPHAKYTDNLIKVMAQKQIGTDKEANAQFMYVLNQKSLGKSPDEKLAIAKQELEKVPDPDSWFWSRLGLGKVPKYQLDNTAAEGHDLAQGQMYQDVGYKQAQAISQGMGGSEMFERNANPEKQLQAFANALNVKYEDMKIGTPVNNAIESLRAKGKSVTPYAVQKVLEKHKDGNWR